MTPDSIAEIDAIASAIDGRETWPAYGSQRGRIQAAVSVPLHRGGRGLEVWAIKRTDGLRHHAREIAFPGGQADDGDVDLRDTALRELEEELGISRDQVRVLGAMGPVPTATSRFTLNPYLVLVTEGAVARPQVSEVAALIRMPLADFFAGRVPYRAVELADGRRSPIFEFELGAMYGASAHILDELLRTCAELRGVPYPEPELTDRIPWQ
ncbi:MAG TPA: CoA pyrophosphatase [Candidatus Dormibacteraeota bacterium]|nr:CoA pyrophosphatase [Candidatus Dormibacteraeota bacterium]